MKTTTQKKVTVKEVRDVCQQCGVAFKRISETGEFKVGGYFTDDAQDAIDTARAIALSNIPSKPAKIEGRDPGFNSDNCNQR